jgi:hypothetical protein
MLTNSGDLTVTNTRVPVSIYDETFGTVFEYAGEVKLSHPANP